MSRSKRSLPLIVTWGLLLGGMLQAQDSWQGNASLVVQVTDEQGQRLAGATVLLRFLDVEPPAVLQGMTEASGQTVIENLAVGEWQIDVRREGFMLYTAYVRLGGAKGPEVGFSTRQRTGSFWAPLEVAFSEVGGPPPGLTTEQARKQEKQAVKRRDQDARREARAESRSSRRGADVARVVDAPRAKATQEKKSPREPRRRRGEDVARVVEPSSPPTQPPTPTANDDEKDEQMPQATPSQPRQAPEPRRKAEAATPAPHVEPEPTVTPQATPPATRSPAPAPEPAEPQVRSAPEPEPAIVPTPKPKRKAESRTRKKRQKAEPAPPVRIAEAPRSDRVLPRAPIPTVRTNPTLKPAGACPECKPGEWSVTAELETAPRSAPGAESCGQDIGDRMDPLVALLAGAAEAQADLTSYAGPLVDRRGGGLLVRLEPTLHTRASQYLTPLTDPASSCHVVAIALPRGARYIGFRYEAADALSVADCLPDQDCLIGESRWISTPRVERDANGTVVYGIFENRSTDRQRRPRLTVYFVPPRGWVPPSSP